MRDYKNIDRIFQENLKDFEVTPPYKSWAAIDKKLNNTPKKRSISIWTKISSIAALLVLFFSIGSIYFIPQNNFTKNSISKKGKTQKTVSENDNSTNIVAKNSELNKVKKPSHKGRVIPLKVIKEDVIINESTESIAVTSNLEEKRNFQKSSNNFSLLENEDLLFENATKDLVPEISENKFTVATIFAPIYFNSFGNGSGTDEQFNNNQTSGNTSYAYGVKVAYKLNNKFSVQSGINMINLGHKTNNVYVTPGVAIANLSNISNSPIPTKNADLSKEISKTNESSANLNQVFGYVEIPVELKYNVTNGKIGINLVGGFSTLLLNKDEVFVETNSFSQSLGNSNNLRSINFSGNFGLDVDYSIYKNVYINVSPMFKVQTNTFSKASGSIQSYYLGVYTGLNYKF